MRLLIALLVLAFSLPASAQEKKTDKKPAAEKKTDKKAPAKKAEKKPAKKIDKKEKTTAQPKQDWGRFSSQSKADEKARTEQKAK